MQGHEDPNESASLPNDAENAQRGVEALWMDVGGKMVEVPVTDVPGAIRATCPEFEIDTKRIWGLQLQPQPIALDEVAWMLELPVWPENGKPFTLRPVDVIRSPRQHPEHAMRIERASPAFPLDVIPYRGRLVILEGCHRACKAIAERQPTIMARIIPHGRIPDIIDWTATVPTFDLRQFMKSEYGMDI